MTNLYGVFEVLTTSLRLSNFPFKAVSYLEFEVHTFSLMLSHPQIESSAGVLNLFSRQKNYFKYQKGF
jgi:hypothetical protein